MERYFDHLGRAGRTMMCNTAAIQVNVGLGEPDQDGGTLEAGKRAGPDAHRLFRQLTLRRRPAQRVAIQSATGVVVARPTRSTPVVADCDPVTAWTSYALDARVMLVDAADGHFVPMIEPLRFGDWVTDGHELGWPTLDDLRYHLTTLFPPVRPKGWLELRMFDALPSPAWQVAVAVTGALLGESAVATQLDGLLTDSADLWVDAAQLGLGHPSLARSAVAVFDLALEALAAAGVDTERRDLVEAYADRWVRRGRSPADDRVDAWRRTGDLFPPAERPEATLVGTNR